MIICILRKNLTKFDYLIDCKCFLLYCANFLLCLFCIYMHRVKFYHRKRACMKIVSSTEVKLWDSVRVHSNPLEQFVGRFYQTDNINSYFI